MMLTEPDEAAVVTSEADLLMLVPELVAGGQKAVKQANCAMTECEAQDSNSDRDLDSSNELDNEDDGQDRDQSNEDVDSNLDSDDEHKGVCYKDEYECEGFAPL